MGLVLANSEITIKMDENYEIEEMESIDHLRLFGRHFEIICGTNEEYLIAFTIKYAQVIIYKCLCNYNKIVKSKYIFVFVYLLVSKMIPFTLYICGIIYQFAEYGKCQSAEYAQTVANITKPN